MAPAFLVQGGLIPPESTTWRLPQKRSNSSLTAQLSSSSPNTGALLIARNSLPVRPFRKEKGHQRSRPMRPPKPIITSTRGRLIRRFRRVDDLNIDRPREFALRTSNDPGWDGPQVNFRQIDDVSALWASVHTLPVICTATLWWLKTHRTLTSNPGGRGRPEMSKSRP